MGVSEVVLLVAKLKDRKWKSDRSSSWSSNRMNESQVLLNTEGRERASECRESFNFVSLMRIKEFRG